MSVVRVGVDTGGTFTDFVRLDERGLTVHKVRSVPADPSRAILGGLAELRGEGETQEVTHGSTVATNAVLERKGARIGLLATEGFEDVLLIGRQTRAKLYDFMVEGRRPLVEPGLTVGVRERIGADGSVVETLTEDEIARCVDAMRTAQVESVAVCLLHSYRNAEHEERLRAALERVGLSVSASHRILPEYREFERWSTAAVNAYVTPLMAEYLGRLESGLLAAQNERRPLRVMQSNGGSISAGHAARVAVETILSGPAAGVVGAQAVAAESGFSRVITFDMGGTSTDVSLVDGAPGTTNESVVGDFPVRLPVLDIHTVGAGGGSIAYVDSGGSLRVGPRSAGADPGPCCYGKGNELTVTDANLLLGRLDARYFLGGRMGLDTERADAAAKVLAAKVGVSERALAEGVVRIANANMERAIRVVSVQRGYDPREFALLAFGGAGGLHACDLADALEMRTVLIPEHSGVLSALGMLLADAVKNYSAAVLRPAAEMTEAELERVFAPLRERAAEELKAEGFDERDVLLESTLDMRYKGQAFELRVPFAPDYREAFHRAHQRMYGYANPGRATEIVQARVVARGRTEKPALTHAEQGGDSTSAEPVAMRKTIFAGRAAETAVFYRDGLRAGMQGAGPALVISGNATNGVPPGFAWRIDVAGTLVVTRTEIRRRRAR